MLANEASVKALRKTEGFLEGKELIDKGLVFWTLTMWKDEMAMKQFRNSIPHRKAMKNLPQWCCEAAYCHWIQDIEELPSWNKASQELFRQGTLTKVRKPSANQQKNNFPPIKWEKLERKFLK